MLTYFEWIYGITQLTAVFLSIIAGFIAITMFKHSRRAHLSAWKYLLAGLILFAAEMIFGALKIFGIYSNPWITHVIPSFLLVLVIAALVRQIEINRGWIE